MVLSTEGGRERTHTQTQLNINYVGKKWHKLGKCKTLGVKWEWIYFFIAIQERNNWVKHSMSVALKRGLMKDVISNYNRPIQIKALIFLFQFQGLNLSQIIAFSIIWKKWLSYTSAMCFSFILFLFTCAQTSQRAQRRQVRHERQSDEKEEKWQRQESREVQDGDIIWNCMSRNNKIGRNKHFPQEQLLMFLNLFQLKRGNT